MNIFRVLVLVIALIAGGVAAYLSLIVPPPAPEVVAEVPQIETSEVLVVSGDVGPGATLNAENTRWEEWPTSAVNPAFINRDTQPEAIEELDGTIVRSQFFADVVEQQGIV